jgi:hypothetical protein
MTNPMPSRKEAVNPHPASRKLAASALFVLAFLFYTAVPVTVGVVYFWWIGPRAFNRLPLEVQWGFIGGLSLAGVLFALLASKCYIYARRLRGVPSALEIFARDYRPPVVYFRPFTADVDTSKTSFDLRTEEEVLARAMNDIGPLVAIGAPEEKLPLLGAARMYVANEKWQTVALDLLERAILVVMRIGSSAGFWWEFETVMQRVKPEKLVLLIPRDEALYEKFRVASHNLLRTDLPPLTDWSPTKWWRRPFTRSRGHLKAVIFFNSEWALSIVDVKTLWLSFLRRSPMMPLAPVLHTALRPAYENAGLRWTRPPINRWMLFVLATFAASFVFLFVGIFYVLNTGGF